MPMYEFICAACGAEFEEICGANASAPACPTCGSADTRRQISAPSPLKTGAFPFKVGPVHPMASKMGRGLASCPHNCGSGN